VVLALLCMVGMVPAVEASAATPTPEPFGSWTAMVDRTYLDLTSVGPTAAQRTAAVAALSSGSKTQADLVSDLRGSADHTGSVDPVTRLYRAFLLRVPDKGGLEFWIKRRRTGAWTLNRIADSFATSSEFKTRYGKLSNLDFVKLIYDNVLERPYDSSGLGFWTRQLDGKRKTRGAVMANFSESNEYKRKQAAEVTVSVLRIMLLGRAPTTAEFNAEVTAIEAGQSTTDYAAGLLSTIEFLGRVASPLAVTTTSLPDPTTGTPYAVQLTATGGVKPYRWSATGLPTGLTIDKASGIIGGNPTTAGYAPASITVTSAAGPTASRQIGLRVALGTGTTITTPALPSGDPRFIDSLSRDLLGRAPTVDEQAAWTTQLATGTTRPQLASTLVLRDEFLAVVVENQYASLLDRLPTTVERSAGISQVRSSGSTTALTASLLAGAEFFAMAGSSNSAWVNTAAQRVLHRDVWPDEFAALAAALSGTAQSRLQVAGDLYGSVEATQVRARMWTLKLLSREPTSAELTDSGSRVATSGELSVIAATAGGPAYLALAQERVTEASVTTTAGTVVVSGPQVASVAFTDAGAGTVVLAQDVTPPGIGHHLVVSVPNDPALGGIGTVSAITRAANGQTTVTLTPAALSDVFATGSITDTTEAVDPVNAGSSNVVGRSAADPACTAAIATKLRGDVGIDTRSDSKISWGLTTYEVQALVHVTPKLTLSLEELTFSGTCKKELWKTKWDHPLTVGPIVIPGYFQISASAGISGQFTAMALKTDLSIPCRVGVRITNSGSTNLSGCSSPRFGLTVTPRSDATVKAFADLQVGYFVGVDKGGWAKANLGLTFGPEVGLELKASSSKNPYWTVDAYFDVNVDLTGNLLGRWELRSNLATARLLQRRIASGAKDQGTSVGGGTFHPNPGAGVKAGPILFPPPLTGVRSLASGTDHTCALIDDGTVKCWGANSRGQLGDGTTTKRTRPTAVAGLTGAVAIDAGTFHTCAVLTNGTTRCWGENASGQVGDGTTTARTSPVTVTGITGAVEIAAGGHHTCALLANGTTRCWGLNTSGQVGDGTTQSRATPTTVAGLTDVIAIDAGMTHTCSLLANGTARCWGLNTSGQLGDGTTATRTTPVTAAGITNASEIATGGAHTCVLLANGTSRCWGSNASGQLGDGTRTDRTTPGAGSSSGGIAAVSTGSQHTCNLLLDGTARCSGSNEWSQLGVPNGGAGTTPLELVPVQVTDLEGGSAISAGGGHSCAVITNGTASCWGSNENGALGDGTTLERWRPSPVLSGG
jgi:alpha-tubulin suppressor-like RCC1 family protein